MTKQYATVVASTCAEADADATALMGANKPVGIAPNGAAFDALVVLHEGDAFCTSGTGALCG